MTLDILIMLAGFLAALVPFLGFPMKWDAVILVVLGAFIVLLGIVVRRRGTRRRTARVEIRDDAESGEAAYEQN